MVFERFSEVDSTVFRSSIPRTNEDVDFLVSKGISEVISFELVNKSLSAYAESKGVKFHDFSTIDQDYLPDKREATAFFKVIKNAEVSGKKVLLHCSAGLQRSGVMVAVYLVGKGMHPLQAYQFAGTAEVTIKEPLMREANALKDLYTNIRKERPGSRKLRHVVKKPRRKLK
ncbi:MAG: dual specificity protein phosphatase family protein [Candidatus Diapherotrites archaeon]